MTSYQSRDRKGAIFPEYESTSSDQSRDREGAVFPEYESALMKRCTSSAHTLLRPT